MPMKMKTLYASVTKLLPYTVRGNLKHLIKNLILIYRLEWGI